MTRSASLGIHPVQQAYGQDSPGASADVEQDGSPVLPLLLFPLRLCQSLFHLLDPLCCAGNPFLTVSLSDPEIDRVYSSPTINNRVILTLIQHTVPLLYQSFTTKIDKRVKPDFYVL